MIYYRYLDEFHQDEFHLNQLILRIEQINNLPIIYFLLLYLLQKEKKQFLLNRSIICICILIYLFL